MAEHFYDLYYYVIESMHPIMSAHREREHMVLRIWKHPMVANTSFALF